MSIWVVFFSHKLARSLYRETEILPHPFLFLFSSAGGEWPSQGLTLKRKRAPPSAGGATATNKEVNPEGSAAIWP